MENTIKVTLHNNNITHNEQCENTSADIELIITLSPERIIQLQEAVKNFKSGNIYSFTENLIQVFNEPKNTFENVAPLSSLEAAVTAVMNELGIPAHTKGYRYLRDAVVLSAENPEYIDQITKVLYPTVAKAHNSTPVRVERVIRHAIEYCCLKGNAEAVNLYFSQCLASQRGKPTNSEFIAILSDKLRMRSLTQR